VADPQARGSSSIDVPLVRRLAAATFPNASCETLDVLVHLSETRSCRAGDVINHQGEVPSLVAVVEGYLALRRTTVDGRQMVIAIVTRAELSGLLSLVSRPATVDLVALRPSIALLWPGHDVRALALRDPGLARDAMDHAIEWVASLSERVDGLLHQAARRRVTRVLAAYRDLFFGEPAVLSRSNLPALVGTSREMTGRVLRQLEADGILIRTGRDSLRLLDERGLAQAGSDQP
jgi:CRP-like cAMP-binding protein